MFAKFLLTLGFSNFCGKVRTGRWWWVGGCENYWAIIVVTLIIALIIILKVWFG